MSDGETPEEALAMGRDAFACWMTVYMEEGREIPGPGNGGSVTETFDLEALKSIAPIPDEN